MKTAFSLLVLLLLSAAPAWAGPPFQTDDPEPIDYKNFEFYTFVASDSTAAGTALWGPAVEFNWGALPNVHLHIVLPLATSFPSSGPNAVGLGDMETGIKFRFVQETKHRPQIGTFPMFELPAGNAAKGLGVGKTWYKVPIWVQKSFGPWTTYGGGGEVFFRNVSGLLNYPIAGGLLQRDIGKKLTLGTEVFYHGAQVVGMPTGWATMLDVGGYYKFRDPGFQLLFAYGHTIAGQAENYAYVGLYWTWGKQPEKPDTAVNRLDPSHRWSAANARALGRL